MKTAMITGATGFLGYHVLNELIEQGCFVYVVCRPGSQRLNRLCRFKNIHIVELEMDDILSLKDELSLECETFYHLAWEGGRNDISTQLPNIKRTMDALVVASALGCRRFISTGSQAEYGIHHGLITESTIAKPVTVYGAAKLAACNLSRVCATQLGIEWTWARVFSVYGPGDNPNSLIPYLLQAFRNKQIPALTQGYHKWDYLYATDAAKALHLLGTTPHTNTMYNIANGNSLPLRAYVEVLRDLVAPEADVGWGRSDSVAVPLEVSIDKISRETGWQPEIGFEEGITKLLSQENGTLQS